MPKLVALDRKYIVKDRGYLADAQGTECCQCDQQEDICYHVFRKCPDTIGPEFLTVLEACKTGEGRYEPDQVYSFLDRNFEAACYKYLTFSPNDPGIERAQAPPVIPWPDCTDCVETSIECRCAIRQVSVALTATVELWHGFGNFNEGHDFHPIMQWSSAAVACPLSQCRVFREPEVGVFHTLGTFDFYEYTGGRDIIVRKTLTWDGGGGFSAVHLFSTDLDPTFFLGRARFRLDDVRYTGLFFDYSLRSGRQDECPEFGLYPAHFFFVDRDRVLSGGATIS